jgi:hypothetical protein
MSEYSDHDEDWDDVLPNEPNGEVVHWMAPRPMSVGPAGISMAAAGAFALGALATVAVLAMLHMLNPQAETPSPRQKRWRSSIH